MTAPEEDRGSESASTGELIARASEEIGTIVRTEIALAKDDLAQTGKRVGIGAGSFGLAGILALYGIGALLAAAILALASGPFEPWLAAVFVASCLFLVAGLAAFFGKSSLGKAADPPKERVESVQEDVAIVKDRERVDP